MKITILLLAISAAPAFAGDMTCSTQSSLRIPLHEPITLRLVAQRDAKQNQKNRIQLQRGSSVCTLEEDESFRDESPRSFQAHGLYREVHQLDSYDLPALVPSTDYWKFLEVADTTSAGCAQVLGLDRPFSKVYVSARMIDPSHKDVRVPDDSDGFSLSDSLIWVTRHPKGWAELDLGWCK